MSASTPPLRQASPQFALGLDLRQARLVAEALGHRPYAEVHALIAHLEDWTAQPGGAPFVLDLDALALIVRALAELPYRRVHSLIKSLEQQLAALQLRHGAPRQAA